MVFSVLSSKHLKRDKLESCLPVGSVSSAEGVVDVNVTQFGQRRPEGVNLLLRGFGLRDNNDRR